MGGFVDDQELFRFLMRWGVDLKKSREDTIIRPEVIESNTLNFRPDFLFCRLKFFGGTPAPLGVCASKAWPISSACKNFRAQHPLRVEI